MATFGTVIDRVASELRGRTDLNSAIADALRSAIQHYESYALPWNQIRDYTAFTTVAGQRWYSLTTDFVKWVSVKCKFNAAFIPLHPRTLQWIDEEDTQVTPSQGTPQFYAIFNNEMRTFPAANGSYTVIGNYLNRSATLTATASSNGWTTRGEKLIRARAVADIRANVLHQQAALMEMGVLVQTGETKYLSAREKQAHDSVLRESRAKSGSGTMRPDYI
tara:strand:+ start:1785 stop:2444 length:660 start_codon:yes stop_codon:yes gene_type:complete